MALIDSRREIERGRILQILAVRYPDAVSFRGLLSEVVAQGEIVTERALAFHVQYLRERGYVAIEHLKAGRAEIELQTVRLTARGVDLCDGRIAVDPGVAF